MNFNFLSLPHPSHFCSAAGKILGLRHISISILVATLDEHLIQAAKLPDSAAASLLLGEYPFRMLSQLREVTAITNATWCSQCRIWPHHRLVMWDLLVAASLVLFGFAAELLFAFL